jgi:prepilin-type N-terminal cleavage/methylation domain-containing protein
MPRRSPFCTIEHARSGHTLWEMLLVLALLGTIATIVAPAVPSLRRTSPADDVERTTQGLVTLLGQTRLTALERGTAVQLVLDPVSAHVWIFTLVDGETRLLVDSALARTPGAILRADEPRVRFVFYPGGTATGGIVTVRGIDAGAMRRVAVDPWSGAPHVE